MWHLNSPLLTDKQRTALLGDYENLSKQARQRLRDRIIGVILDLATLNQMPNAERKKLFKKAMQGELRLGPHSYSTPPEWEEYLPEISYLNDSKRTQRQVLQMLLSHHPEFKEFDQDVNWFTDMKKPNVNFDQYLADGLAFIFAGLLENDYKIQEIEDIVYDSLTTAGRSIAGFDDVINELLAPNIRTNVSLSLTIADEQPALHQKAMDDRTYEISDILEHLNFRYKESDNKLLTLVKIQIWVDRLFGNDLDRSVSFIESLIIIQSPGLQDPDEIRSNSKYDYYITEISESSDIDAELVEEILLRDFVARTE